MKKLFFVIALFMGIQLSYASFPTDDGTPKLTDKKANELAMMKVIANMSVSEYEMLSGKKMNFFEKISFKATKKRVERKLSRAENLTSGFNLGGFVLGFLVGLIGVLLAYVFSKDKNLRKWSWIGWGASLVLLLILLAV